MPHINPNDIEEGHIVRRKDTKDFFKVKQKLQGNKIKGKRVTPNHEPDPGDEMQINIQQCDKCFTPHEFGQHKRFLPPEEGGAGTGFSKRGRKIKKKRSNIMDDIDIEARQYILENIEFEDMINHG